MTAETLAESAERSQTTAPWRTVQRVVLPAERDVDVLPLYVDSDSGVAMGGEGDDQVQFSLPGEVHAEDVRGRRAVRVPAGRRMSFATYFNAFPASYWRRWTVAATVRLTVEVEGDATVLVYASNARGLRRRVALHRLTSEPLVVDLPLAPFGDGGWYWFDVAAGSDDVTLTSAEWSVPDPVGRHGQVTLAITTFNRPDYCLALLRRLSEEADLGDVVRQFVVVDQGSQRVADEDGFAEVEAAFEGRLRIVRQGNLGGSGGFSRGMYEALQDEGSDYVLLLDDDVQIEPEGVLRAATFADLCRTPTIVGGHMFDMYDRAVLHTLGEQVNPYRFFWGPAPGLHPSHDLAKTSLRRTPWLHRRIDVDYNGWWMCLIPTAIIREIGLGLPLFIKWDDAEFGLRAQAHGHPTVSMPGVAVWHVSWGDKDDTIDWQAYYHERNRFVVALLYSRYPRGGRLLRESVFTDVKHLISMQYSAEALRALALDDILAGPERMHPELPTKLAQIRALRGGYPDAQVRKEPDAFPTPYLARPPRGGRQPQQPAKGRLLPWAARTVARQFTAPRPGSRLRPEAAVPAMESRWWSLAARDSAVVSTADGTGASWYQRDPAAFRSLLARSADLHRRIVLDWDGLRRRYREALPELTSPETWARTFEAAGDPDAGRDGSGASQRVGRVDGQQAAGPQTPGGPQA